MSLANTYVPRRWRISLFLVLLLAGIMFFSTSLQKPLSDISARIHFPNRHNESSTVPTQVCDPHPDTTSIRWSDFAYVQYVTNPSYLCNSLMIFEALRRHNTKAELLMLYPQEWELPAVNESGTSYESKLLAKARDMYGANLSPIKVKTFKNDDDPTWQDSYTKLLAWNQTQYKRVISLDSDATVLDQMDELFLLPSAPVAMPLAYWVDHFFLSSQLIVVEPSMAEWERIQDAMENHEGFDYDMDILNKVYGTSSTVIPHRKYDLLTGEIRPKEHHSYLGSKELWRVKDVLAETKFVHFSDWPMPKPWLEAKPEDWEKYKPKCREISDVERDCSDQEAWLELRRDFTARRERICGQAYDAKAPDYDKRTTLRRRGDLSIVHV
ncbi:unnamed protein product [Periconia digitata]|uniref:Nucleotide-diphospho-sugar transferase n=1 Tax=Periconia digitata TaxID=1303443 RepID=A0A9W4U610_9PLEO|nr:unnamed protein product [Periconia digitata]